VIARLRAADRNWTLAFAAAGLLVAVLHLSALGTSPPGLYIDESSVGYNAWAVAHTGYDEHGHHLPLYFEAFGEYKNPVYIYALAPFTLLLPLTPYVVRLPAALFGLVVCLMLTLFARIVTGSRPAALLTLLTAGITPWLVQESRIGFEVISMLALLAVMLWCFAHAVQHSSWRWYAGGGAALGLSTFAYSTGRASTVLLLLAILASFGVRTRGRAWLASLAGPLAGVLTLVIYNGVHSGAITARYNAISINFDSPGIVVLVQRFISNYVDYWDVRFLFTHGDANLRHSTGWGGMLLVTTLPAILLGAVQCLRRWREPLPRFLLLGAVLGPVPAALTAEGTPHSLRAAGTLPFLLALAAYGWCTIAERLLDRRTLAAIAAAAVAAEAASFFYDLYVEYPGRALAWFDTGQGPAIARAVELAGSNQVLLSSNLDGPYIQALFYLRPDPPLEGQPAEAVLAALGVRIAEPAAMGGIAHHGDILVLAPGDTVPGGAQVVEVEERLVGGGAVSVVGNAPRPVELAVIARD
jgi:4-amino-4-deoxy-L-arabinose transferase-like glycosyltransferase